MVITLSQPTDALQHTCKQIKLLKQKMENVRGKRPRFSSETSNTSTNTQLTNVSDDSSRTTSPNDVKQFGDRPIFRLGSQDDAQPSVTTPLTPSVTTSMTYEPSTNRRAVEREREAAYSMERRKLLAARRAKYGRRQSDSVIESAPHHVAPHRSHTTMCMDHDYAMEDVDERDEETFSKRVNNPFTYPTQSTSNIEGALGYRQNFNTNTPVHPYVLQQNKPRSHSVDGLNGMRVTCNRSMPHVYDDVNDIRVPRHETEVRLYNEKPVIGLSRKRLNSSLSETPPERLNNDLQQTDAGSAYVRNIRVATPPSFCETLSFCLKRYSFLILVLLNILLLFVNFAGLPYLAIKTLESDKSRSEYDALQSNQRHCFKCNEITWQNRDRISKMAGVLTVNDQDQCCFNTTESFTSWAVKEITSKRTFIYVKGEDTKNVRGEIRIRWSDNGKLGTVSLDPDRTKIIIHEPGYYFIFSRLHFVRSKPGNQSSRLTLWHAIKHEQDGKQEDLVIASETCNLQNDSLHIEHNSVLETIAYLRQDDLVYVYTRGNETVDRNKEHSLGLFFLQR